MAAKPVRGDIGLLVIPEAQAFDYLLSYEGKFDTYAAAMWGAYRGFFDNNIQADWVHIEDIDAYDTLYAPYPIALTAENAAKLAAWVEAGGTLISEACPGYFGDRGRVGTVQPNNGLDAVFGAREVEVEFMPDIADRSGFTYQGNRITAGGFLQAYAPTTGTPRGDFADGRLAVVENAPRQGPHAPRRHASLGRLLPHQRRSRPPLVRRRLRLDRADPARRDRQPARAGPPARGRRPRLPLARQLDPRGAGRPPDGPRRHDGPGRDRPLGSGRRLLRRRRLHRPAARRAGGRDPGLTSPLGIDGEAPVAPRPVMY